VSIDPEVAMPQCSGNRLLLGSLFAVLVAAGCPTRAQNSQPAFEAASIKANNSGSPRTDGTLAGSRFTMINEPAWRLVAEAFAAPLPLPRSRVIGGPDWLDTARFDVEAVAATAPSREQARLMLRTLLAERFGLVAHRESRPSPIFNLVVAREDRRVGPSLRASAADCAATQCLLGFGFGRLTATGQTMGDLAERGLSRVSGRPTVDRTGLSGRFDWMLIWTPDNLPPRAPGLPADQPLLVNGIAVDPNGPTLPTALQEQLGLRLEPATGPVDVIVIDRIEQPSEN
jgi:uncharacterized protein (TIGR03435 family)